MIRPRLLHLGSTDLIDPPQDPTCCMVAVTARIGTSDGDAGDDFHFTVATPDGLADPASPLMAACLDGLS